MPTLTREGDVFVLNLGDGENRFHPDWIASVNGCLDEVADADAPRALVTTATGKIYSNGLDLDWLGQNPDSLLDYVVSVHELFARVLEFPGFTIAAMQGHTFAAGAMLALAHDQRVMRADRGFFCLPEADINIPFVAGMNSLLLAKLTPRAATEAMVTARRFGGEDALAADIVDAIAAEGEVLPKAIEMAAPQAPKVPATLGAIKARMYEETLRTLRDRELILPS